MHAFIITAPNTPGQLAKVLDGVAQRGINVTAGGAATWEGGGAIAIQVNDDEGARAALQGAGITFREADVAAAWLEDRPGTLADAARRLGEAGVNIEAFFPIGMEGGKVGILFAVSDGAAAKAALGELTGAAAG